MTVVFVAELEVIWHLLQKCRFRYRVGLYINYVDTASSSTCVSLPAIIPPFQHEVRLDHSYSFRMPTITLETS